MSRLILASASEARAQLLRAAGYVFEQMPSDFTEQPPDSAMRVEDYVTAAAMQKAIAVLRKFPDAHVIGADTLVCCDGAPFGKPGDCEEAASMLMRLAGKTHRIVTGVCVAASNMSKVEIGFDAVEVTLRGWPEERIRKHIETVKPLFCAGAYAVQGGGAAIIERIAGDITTVIGLPMKLLEDLLARTGFESE